MSRSFRLASILSFVLCLAVMFLWVHSYRRCDTFNWARQNGQQVQILSAVAASGSVWFSGSQLGSQDLPGLRRGLLHESGPPYREWIIDFWTRGIRDSKSPKNARLSLRFAGFDIFAYRGAVSGWWVVFPYWFPFLLTATLPMTFLWRLRRARRRAGRGLCPRCGYDLRASKDKCPECGTEIHAARPSLATAEDRQ